MTRLLDRLAPEQLAGCDREPIHLPGAIQPHGALLAFGPDLRVIHAGGDTTRLLGQPPAALLGTLGAAVLPSAGTTALATASGAPERLPGRPRHAFSLSAAADGAPVDALLHQSGAALILEFEPRPAPDPPDPLALVQAMIRQVQQADSVAAACEAIASEVRAVLGFERVMVYRFLADDSGEVVAEAREAGVESFLGLHYPASDIPKQARALYVSNAIRAIPDARYAAAPLLAVGEAAGKLDLSQSVLRSVSPVHLQYLANMGVTASLSLSIVLRGRLWGLVACHHASPRYLPWRLRDACALFAEMAAAHLESKLAAASFAARLHTTRIHEELLRRMSGEQDMAQGLMRNRPNLLDFIRADGAGLWVDGQFTGRGVTPTPEQVADLVQWLNTAAHDGVFNTDALPLLYPPAASFADVASGILALSVSRSPRDYVIWFRPEVIRTVTWAGNPAKPLAEGDVLTPRRSFAAWQETVRLHAEPWLEAEVEAAQRLHVSLLEVVLRRIDQLAREREQARAQQENLMRELDRRLAEAQSATAALQQETRRRAVAESELSQVLRRTVEDQEAERLRIARELHDTLGQSLTLLQLGLDEIGKHAPATEARVAALKRLAAGAGREASRLAWEIRPTALDDLGIVTATRALLETWSERSGVPFDLHIALDEQRLSPAIETTLYRVLQEALTNVLRHAGATRVGVIVRLVEGQVSMIIEDNGSGFGWDDGGERPAKRLGLLGMRERLALVGGALEIESAPGHGTTLFVRIPL